MAPCFFTSWARRLLLAGLIGALACGPSLAQAVGDDSSAAVPRALAIAKADNLRIMVLGDSITAGIVGGNGHLTGGYRRRLENLLEAGGYRFTFVGGRTDYSASVIDPHHEGWPGYVIRSIEPDAPGELLGTVVEHAVTRYNPDLILLMAGTNDLLRYERHPGSYDEDLIVDSMALLLDEIFMLRPHVRVILGGIVDSPKVDRCLVQRFDTGSSPCSTETFANLRSLVGQFQRRGFAIAFADGMYTAVPRDLQHFPDGIHPADGPGGYDAIADVWYRAIQAITVAKPGSGSVSER